MSKKGKILVVFVFLISFGVQAQVDSIKNRLRQRTTTEILNKTIIKAESLKQFADSVKPKAFKPDPTRVVWMAAVIPGYGQILNKKYWKLPIVYGGFLGMAYLVTLNSNLYSSYKNAYLDILRYESDANYKIIVDKNPRAASFNQILPKGYTVDSYGGISQYTDRLKVAQESSRRNRDLSVIATVGYYALTIVDAFVDAQLYDFDISPDLSIHLQPAIMQNAIGVPNALAMQCTFNLK